jgi:surface polysaccharide O-acyltransferase-like enzyme
MALLSRFGSTHALVDDWHNHAVYGFLFVLGAGLARQPALFDRMAERRWLALAASLICWALLNAYFGVFSDAHLPPEWLRQLQRVVHATLQWSAIVAVLGFARRHLDVDHRWRRPFNEAVYPCYLLHQTVIILAAVALSAMRWPVTLEAPVLLGITFGACLLVWRLVRRIGVLRPWFGIAAAPGP